MSFTYINDGSAASTDTFQYVAVDAHNAQSEQTVTVAPVPQAIRATGKWKGIKSIGMV